MKRLGFVLGFVFPLSLLASGFAFAADDMQVKVTTNQAERSYGKVGEGVELREAGKTVEPPATTAWGAVKGFFTDPFTGDSQDRRFQLDIAR